MRRAISALELTAFRSPYFGKGLEGVEAALEGAGSRSWRHTAVRRLKDADWQAARDLLKRLVAIFVPIEKAFASAKPASVHELARLHFATAQALAKMSDADDGNALRQGEAGEWAAKFFASLIDEAMPVPDMAAADYPEFYRTLVAEKSIRSRRPTHPRIFIWDPFEARLQQPDVVILGSLNEGTWPQAADPGPVAQPADAAGAGPAGAGGAHRRCGAHLHLAARRGARVSHARRQDRRRADGALALAAAPAGAAGGARTGAQARAAVARLGAGAQRDRRPGAARARARAAPAAGAAAAPAQRHHHREAGSPTPTPSSPSASWGSRRCRCWAASPRRRCAARSCTRRSAASRSAFRGSCRRTSPSELMEIARGGARRLHRLAAGGRVLGAALCPLRRVVRRDGAAPARRHDDRRWPRWRAPWCLQGRPGPSR